MSRELFEWIYWGFVFLGVLAFIAWALWMMSRGY